MSALTVEAMVHDLLGGAPYMRTDGERTRTYESERFRIVLGSGQLSNVVIDKKSNDVYRTVSIAHRALFSTGRSPAAGG